MEQEAKLKEKEARSTLLRDGEKGPQDPNSEYASSKDDIHNCYKCW